MAQPTQAFNPMNTEIGGANPSHVRLLVEFRAMEFAQKMRSVGIMKDMLDSMHGEIVTLQKASASAAQQGAGWAGAAGPLVLG